MFHASGARHCKSCWIIGIRRNCSSTEVTCRSPWNAAKDDNYCDVEAYSEHHGSTSTATTTASTSHAITTITGMSLNSLFVPCTLWLVFPPCHPFFVLFIPIFLCVTSPSLQKNCSRVCPQAQTHFWCFPSQAPTEIFIKNFWFWKKICKLKVGVSRVLHTSTPKGEP